MSINLTIPDNTNTGLLKPKLTVIGVGGAGGNAVNNMIRSELEGVDFVVANTDAQALETSKTDRRLPLWLSITQGLGAGSPPEVCRVAPAEAVAATAPVPPGLPPPLPCWWKRSAMSPITRSATGARSAAAWPMPLRRPRCQGSR